MTGYNARLASMPTACLPFAAAPGLAVLAQRASSKERNTCQPEVDHDRLSRSRQCLLCRAMRRSASYLGKSGGSAAPANHRMGMPTAQRYLFHDRLIHPTTERKRL
jgi:hypothetical protein